MNALRKYLALFLVGYAGWATAAPAIELGVLILAPEERMAVLSARKVEDGGGKQSIERLRLDGVLQRPDASYWIADQKSRREGETLENGQRPRVVADGVLIGRQRWRVGETYDLTTGRVEAPLKWTEK